MLGNEDDWSKKRSSFLVVGAIMSFVGIYSFLNVEQSGYAIRPVDLQTIDSLVISEGPFFRETHGKSSGQWIEFRCERFQKRFEITHFDYQCVNVDGILNDLKAGDTISVQLLKEDVENINEETFNSKSNDIHSLFFKDVEYLDIECRNRRAKGDKEFLCYLCLFLAPLTISLGFFKNNPKLFGFKIDPTLTIVIIGALIMLFLKFYVFA